MSKVIDRRGFLVSSGAAGAGLALASQARAADRKTRYRKALIGAPSEETLTLWKKAGFDGMEARGWNVPAEQAAAARQLAEKCDMQIHSVLRGWTNFNQAAKVEADVAGVETALRTAAAYGAGAILLVPCRLGKMAMPQPWEFDIEFDERTGHISRVVAGDNSPYETYIRAHNEATDMSRRAVEKLIPTAEKTGVIVALENVWNNLWVKPDLLANFIGSFDSPWVQCYFDIGNHVKYAPPEEWIRALGERIVRCHIKDFKLNDNGQGGSFCNIRDGSVNWPAVMQELDKLDKPEMWMTIEGSGGLSIEQRSGRLDAIIAGQ